ncbi:MAG TPA: stage II sporulation protein P [Syntrophomonas sp.]|nr:stage II sporulation protein P [Syntrophomonas sp.]
MDTINKRYIWIFFIILLVVMAAAYIINTLLPENPKPYLKTSTGETTSGNFYTVRDEKGMTIFQTGLAVHIDDRYISENDVEYVVIKIDGLNAQASIVQTQDKPNLELNDHITSSTLRLNQAVPTVVAKPTHVVMYHTHDDESYIPTDGKASQPAQGGVLKVGEALTKTLKNAGVSVTHNQDSHGPHDVNAYHRSRRTAVQLIKEQPDAILDIHRDSAPVKAYYTTINGIDCARVMIVIGRSNPNMKTNLAYARQIKASADKLYPGLCRGIFMGRGDYNQDLYPTAILFEIGTEKISRNLAENSARCLGDVLIRELGARRS